MSSLSTLSVLHWCALLAGISIAIYTARMTTLYLTARRTSYSLVNQINQLLPQTQCGQCGHPGCLPYARAISRGAAIDLCPPGGDVTVIRLAHLLDEPNNRVHPSQTIDHFPAVARIREAECIGCTKCIQACPVDAILGGPKRMHTVIEQECTGCDLCVEPCPVDCIDMVPLPLENLYMRLQLQNNSSNLVNLDIS